MKKAIMTEQDKIDERQEYLSYKKFLDNPQELNGVEVPHGSILTLVPCVDKYIDGENQDGNLIWKGDSVVAEEERKSFNSPILVVSNGGEHKALVKPLDYILVNKDVSYLRTFFYNNIMFGVLTIHDVAVVIPKEKTSNVSMKYKA